MIVGVCTGRGARGDDGFGCGREKSDVGGKGKDGDVDRWGLEEGDWMGDERGGREGLHDCLIEEEEEEEEL